MIRCHSVLIESERKVRDETEKVIKEFHLDRSRVFEDTVDMREKYWVYEMCPHEMITMLSEVEMLNDFYIVSKKRKRLISECHEDIMYFAGDGIDISKIN